MLSGYGGNYGSDSESYGHGGFRGEDAYASGGHGGYDQDSDSDDDRAQGPFSGKEIADILRANGRNADGSEMAPGSRPSPRPTPQPTSRPSPVPSTRSVESHVPSEDVCHSCGSARPTTLNRGSSFAPHLHSSNSRPQVGAPRSQSYSGPSGRPGGYASANYTPPSSSHGNSGRRASQIPTHYAEEDEYDSGGPRQPLRGNAPPTPPQSYGGNRGSVSQRRPSHAQHNAAPQNQEWDGDEPPPIRTHYHDDEPPAPQRRPSQPQRRPSQAQHNATPVDQEWDGDEPPPIRTHYQDDEPPAPQRRPSQPQRRPSQAQHNAAPVDQEWDGDEPPPIRTHYHDDEPPAPQRRPSQPQRRPSQAQGNAAPVNQEWEGDEPPPIRLHGADSPEIGPMDRRPSHHDSQPGMVRRQSAVTHMRVGAPPIREDVKEWDGDEDPPIRTHGTD